MTDQLANVTAFAQRAPKQAEKLIRANVIDLWSRVIRMTPVGNPDLWKKQSAPPGYVGGRLRGNWFATIGRPSSETTSSTNRKGAAAGEAARVVSSSFLKDATYYLTNNLPYAERVENGWSTQAPSGMVKANVAGFNARLEAAARKHS